MKKLALLALLAVLLAGCKIMPPGFDPDYGIPPIGARTVQEIGLWLSTHITYTSDCSAHRVAGYWQTPAETYQHRTGDCVDFALLMMYMIRHEPQLGGFPEFVEGYAPCGYHAWVDYKGAQYESETGDFVSSVYDCTVRIDYSSAMWRAEIYHHE